MASEKTGYKWRQWGFSGSVALPLRASFFDPIPGWKRPLMVFASGIVIGALLIFSLPVKTGPGLEF